jgi:hypothetical protein
MADQTLETFTEMDRSLKLYQYGLPGYGLKFVSGPEVTKSVEAGDWLTRWEEKEGKRIFAFGTTKDVVFATKLIAESVREELKKEVGIDTEIA